MQNLEAAIDREISGHEHRLAEIAPEIISDAQRAIAFVEKAILMRTKSVGVFWGSEQSRSEWAQSEELKTAVAAHAWLLTQRPIVDALAFSPLGHAEIEARCKAILREIEERLQGSIDVRAALAQAKAPWLYGNR